MAAEPSGRRTGRWIGIGVAVLLIAAFAWDNRRPVRIGFVVADRAAPLYWILLVTAGLGAVAGWLAARRD